MKIDPNELFTLRSALRMIGQPATAPDVKRLRDRLKARERRDGIRILTDRPYRITLLMLRRQEPAMFLEKESFFEQRAIALLAKLARRKATRPTDD